MNRLRVSIMEYLEDWRLISYLGGIRSLVCWIAEFVGRRHVSNSFIYYRGSSIELPIKNYADTRF